MSPVPVFWHGSIKITIIVAIVLLYGEHFGMSLSGLLTFGGIGGIAVGMAGKDVLSNFFLRYYALFRSPLQYRRLDSFS